MPAVRSIGNACLDGPLARFTVSDNGRGIEPAFSRGSSSRSSPPATTAPAWAWRSRGGGAGPGGDIRIDSGPVVAPPSR